MNIQFDWSTMISFDDSLDFHNDFQATQDLSSITSSLLPSTTNSPLSFLTLGVLKIFNVQF